MKSFTLASKFPISGLWRPALAAAALAAASASASAQVLDQLFEDEEARAKLSELDLKITALENNIQTLASETVKLNTTKRELLEKIRELSGLLEETNQMVEQQDTELSKIDGRIGSESTKLKEAIDKGYASLRSQLKSNDQDLYERGLTAYNKDAYQAAEKAFDELLLRYPASSYAHAALFWQGQMQRDQGYDVAAQDVLLRLVADYPDSPRLPDALLLLEQISIALGDQELAEYWQRRLLEQHPTSAAADRRRQLAAAN